MTMMMKLRPVSLAALALLSGLGAVSAQAQERKPYVVQLAGEPVASYNGNVQGYAATAPGPGQRLDMQAAAARAYVNYLDGKQKSVLATIANAPVTARYDTVINGFAAQLTDAEVLALRANAQVIDIQADEAHKVDTISTPRFLGLTAPGGVWSQAIGGLAVKGEDIIIGMIDSGVWPENLAYADKVDAQGRPTFGEGTQAYGPPPAGWTGSCAVTADFKATNCNNKLIGARHFNATFKSLQTAHWSEFDSPRDSLDVHGGHGSHTASTAGGNAMNPVVQDGIMLGDASGIAPRARLAAYKVCWTYVDSTATDGTGSANTCYFGDIVSAVDQAVKDGVHVLSMSIGGSQTAINDIVSQAYLRAARAGIFVANSAGNNGPANQVAHLSPWVSTVGMSTHDRFFQGTVTLGDGSSVSGASLNDTPVPAAPVVAAEAVKTAAAAEADAKRCFLNSLDPALVAGKVVLCTRGSNDRVQKSKVVADAGGVGMIMEDTGNTLAGLVSEKHSVPTVHVTSSSAALIRTYMAANAGPTAALSRFSMGTQPAPFMDSGSSRGPNKFDANVLKPDITAPGVGIFASWTVNMTETQKADLLAGTLDAPLSGFKSINGTSMATPHVAGAAALLRQLHPGWSPMAIKSALLTSTFSVLADTLTGQQQGNLPWAQGAGHIDINKAADPGLVYDAGAADWTKYQCKVNKASVSPASDCTTVGTLDESYNLNLPTITVGIVPGVVNVTRRVTNVGTSTATYTSTLSVPGFTGTVSPSSLTLAPGETKSFTVNLVNAGAAENVWQFGALTWTDGSHVVRSPVTVRAGKPIVAADTLSATSVSGSRLITVRTGFTGKLTANKGGLKAATMSAPISLKPGKLSNTQLKNACITGKDLDNLKVYSFAVPTGAIASRFALRSKDVGDASDDFDLGVLAPDGTTWTYSGNDGSNEMVHLPNPAAGSYKVCVVSYSTKSGKTTMTHSLSSWIVTPDDVGGKFTVALPGTVNGGVPSTVGFGWSGLQSGQRYLGGAQFKDQNGVVQATTIITVNPDEIPAAQVARSPSSLELSKQAD